PGPLYPRRPSLGRSLHPGVPAASAHPGAHGGTLDGSDLKDARKLCRSFSLLKKQRVTNTTELQNRCPLRQRALRLLAAYPRIDLASLIQTDPQRFWITGRLSLVYHR